MDAELIFDNVTVQYPIFNGRSMSLRNHLVRISTGGRIEGDTNHIHIVTALKDVSFTINKGDTIGLIGHNGAGKSTMLRTMAGVYAPIQGEVKRKGRVATVLELGTGMDPELTGYENITRMSMMLGVSTAQIKHNTQEIEEFTQLGNFLSLPVRTYSSGMATRLMFAVATSTKPDILLVDEIFGTGDAEFQLKAKKRMEDLIRSVGIFVFASHDNNLVRQYCNRFFFLEHGTVREVTRDALPSVQN
jgi:ABC-type polysaccharide/polyol phosphate transport system ATPase subunit